MMREWIQSRLVPDARACWRWFSTWAMFVTMAIQGTYESIPEGMRQSLPDLKHLTIGLMVLGFVGRITKQKTKDENAD